MIDLCAPSIFSTGIDASSGVPDIRKGFPEISREENFTAFFDYWQIQTC
jgi:hypothetical protein